ncbi:amidohydrolase family protein [Wenzhouxiangellaceae bacterium CH-27]|uniref:Amidohydrolase family protein n=2 Tax=Elongatibacter sediminis TaxID=3119006 RepID=A0AAW9RK99_9GAMM
MKALAKTLSALLLSLAMSSPVLADEVVVHAGTLLAQPGEPAQNQQSIVIVDGVITEIRDGFIGGQGNSTDRRVIDLSDQFVMPGFIDLHVHLSSQAGDGRRTDTVTMSDADVALNASMYARRTLMAGFTTLRDLGSRGEPLYALRDAIRANKVAGPRLLVAGPAITPTGGHGDVHGYRAEILEVLASPAVCDGADDCRRAVRRAVKLGADVIKVTATGGVLSNTATGTGQQFTDEELRAIAETAHALGRKVTAHAHAREGIIAAAEAGFDSIEHAMWADEETMKILKRLDVWIIPTVYPITYVGDTPEKMKQGPLKDLPPASMAKLLELGRQPKDMTRLAHEKGVRIALGTDSAISPHGENAHEFIEYVNAGLSPTEALQAGTVYAAEAAGIADTTGSIVPGKAADIVGLGASPLDDIEAVLDVRFVMRDGIVFKQQD